MFSDTRRRTIIVVFVLHGAVVGSFFSRIADLQTAIGLTEAQLGLALIGMSAGVFAGSLVVSRAIETHGVRGILLLTLPLFATGPLLVALLAAGPVSLFFLLSFLGLGLASWIVSMNVEADRIEAADGRRLLNRCHAMWAVGFLAATVSGTAAVAVGLPPAGHFAILLLVVGGVALGFLWPMRPAPPREHRGDGTRRRFARPTAGIFLIMGFAISGMWLESTTRNWSVIFLRDVYDPAEWVATLTLPAIIIFQIVGRFAADSLIDRFGPVLVARMLTAISLAGLALVVAGGSIALSLAGFALVGLGISTVHPQAMSAAARLGDRPSSENLAALATLQTILGLVSPPLIGAVASAFGIRTSFALLLPLPIMAIYFARYLSRRS